VKAYADICVLSDSGAKHACENGKYPGDFLRKTLYFKPFRDFSGIRPA